MVQVPSQARAVIIGGGIVGCSTAYHLAKLGWRDVVLLEHAKLTSGSTFHAAGLVGQLRTNANITQILKYSVKLYDELEEETGQGTGWKMNGGLRLSCNEERWTEVKRQATTARSFGLEMDLLSPSEAQNLWPFMDVSDVVGAAFLPTDGQANPSDITLALAKGARQGGVTIVEECPTTAITVKDGRVTGVTTAHGEIACEVVINCAGQWAREVGRLAEVNVPLISVQHQYMITEPIDGVPRDLPTLRDPDRLIYFKEEVGGLVMGGYERNPIPWAEDGIPKGFHYSLLDNDWDHFEQLMEQALIRVPALETAGVKEMINGPESFTPDGNFILGEAPEVANFYVGAGFNAYGIAGGGGAGKALAEWVVGGEPPLDLWPVDIRRFGQPHGDIDWVRSRTLELYGKHYTMAWPHEEHESGRPNRVSPIYETLKAQGACFGEKLGWERPNWFASNSQDPRDIYSYGRQNWFDAVGEEHRAVRERAAVFDQSSFAKFLVSGPDAAAALTWICANDVDKPVGSLTYTQMLDARGGIQRDLTVARFYRERVLHRHRYRIRHARLFLDRAQHPGRAGRNLERRYPGLRDVFAHGAARDTFSRRSRPTTWPTAPFRSPPAARSPSAMHVCARCVSPTWASWAGSCTCPPGMPSAFTSGSWRLGGNTASPTPATGPSNPCAWKKATAPGARTSGPTIRRSKPGSAGRPSSRRTCCSGAARH